MKEFSKHVYLLCDPDTGFVRYVGASHDLRLRMATHRYQCRKRRTPASVWLDDLYSAGKAPVMECLGLFGPDDWEREERFMISYLRFVGCDLLNVSTGGVRGNSLTPANKRALIKAVTGRVQTEAETEKRRATTLKNYAEGYTQSSESRVKRSNALKGRPPSKEAFEASVRACNGRKVSDESRAKMRESARVRRECLAALGIPRFSPETLQKLSEATRRRNLSKKNLQLTDNQ